ncbi:MAG: GTP cyclohydrolase I FolE2 [Planctomycetota bacterium]|nr:MAG: GTP cyclohydrolase I FolE2 [Planctomycetota bacterium]
MPDIANQARSSLTGTLDLVGMSDIEVPVRLPGGMVSPARASAYVSLDDPDAKGIHMSRLFLALQDCLMGAELSPALLRTMLERFIDSHRDLSQRARVEIHYDLLLQRPALVSDNWGWRSYPATMIGELGPEGFRCEIGVRITYSSTCPCSAALARQLIQERFDRDFVGRSEVRFEEFRDWLGREDAICATPHSQRSHADVEVQLEPSMPAFNHEQLINLVEMAVQTPVQAAVKREDEQEFARLNGENLMFCEDAGRRLTAALGHHPAILDYRVRASHRESLHPHDAVSVAVKGLDGGFRI